MKIIIPLKVAYTDKQLDAILDDPAPTAVSDLELLDLLIRRAFLRHLEVSYQRPAGCPTVDAKTAYRLRYDCGLDLRSAPTELGLPPV